MSTTPHVMDAVRASYNRASKAWTGAAWPHFDEGLTGCCCSAGWHDENECHNAPCGVCSRCRTPGPHEDCGTCRSVEDDAAEAEQLARDSLDDADSCDWDAAVESAAAAVALECEYGDARTWRLFLEAVMDARDIAETQVCVDLCAASDAFTAGLPTDRASLLQYRAAFEEAMEAVAWDRGLLNVRVVHVTSYDSQEADGCWTDDEDTPGVLGGLWQAAHTRIPWGPV